MCCPFHLRAGECIVPLSKEAHGLLLAFGGVNRAPNPSSVAISGEAVLSELNSGAYPLLSGLPTIFSDKIDRSSQVDLRGDL
jgi:hypothetical protein